MNELTKKAMHTVSIRVQKEDVYSVHVSWLRILDAYSLITAITPTILDTFHIFYGRKNVHSGTIRSPAMQL